MGWVVPRCYYSTKHHQPETPRNPETDHQTETYGSENPEPEPETDG